MEKSLFEQIGGTYTQVGDCLLPDVELPNEKPIGVWGTRHYHHLRETNRILFNLLIIFYQKIRFPAGNWEWRYYMQKTVVMPKICKSEWRFLKGRDRQNTAAVSHYGSRIVR